MSLLTLVQDAMLQIGLTSPSIVYNSDDATVQHFRRLAQVEGDYLVREHDWPQQKVAATYTGDGTSTTFDLPVDFHRWIPGHAFWLDDSPGWPLDMVTDEIMIDAKAANAAPIRPIWRRFGDQIELYPALTSGEVIKTQYFSEYWILDEDDTTRKYRWEADSDQCIIPERLVTLGVIWRYKQARGLDYAEDFRSYQIAKMQEIKAAQSSPIISMHGMGRWGGKSDPKVTV
jgi:hypothetical protein